MVAEPPFIPHFGILFLGRMTKIARAIATTVVATATKNTPGTISIGKNKIKEMPRRI
jgi:hypothetical protein